MTIATAIVTGSIGEQSIEVPANPTAGVRGSGMPSIGFSFSDRWPNSCWADPFSMITKQGFMTWIPVTGASVESVMLCL